MTRDEIEQKLWADQYHWGMIESEDRSIAGEVADAAVAQFRKRYPAEPAAPAPVWYDEPPFPGEYHVAGLPCVCWVDQDIVYYPEWDRDGERPRIREMSRAGRRVAHIVKPQGPPQ